MTLQGFTFALPLLQAPSPPFKAPLKPLQGRLEGGLKVTRRVGAQNFALFLCPASILVFSSLPGGLLVELWQRFKAVNRLNCALVLLWGHFVRAPAGCHRMSTTKRRLVLKSVSLTPAMSQRDHGFRNRDELGRRRSRSWCPSALCTCRDFCMGLGLLIARC